MSETTRVKEESAGGWRAQLSIRWILPLALVANVVVVALVLTILCYRTGVRSANDLAAQNARQIHLRIEEHLDRLMDLPPAVNQVNAAHLREGVLSLDDPAPAASRFSRRLRRFLPSAASCWAALLAG